MREMPLDEYTAAVARHLGREPDERLRAACAIAQEKAQTLEEVWPLIRFLFEPPVDDPKAWAKVMKEGSGEMLEAAAEALAAVEPFEPEAIEVGSGAAAGALRGQAGQALPADPGRDHRQLRLPGHLRVAGGAGAGGDAGTASERRLSASRCADTGRMIHA